ncbi:MAG: metallophosphoesterase, partial [Candidatus Marinimicrobia bacterium]|nr:metallophosphoesterase [Candidatus Neomarinimicrobiota bacterium]
MRKYTYLLSLLFLLSIMPGSLLSGQTEITGVVFEDLNNNSKLDNDEPGIPNVAVSNGIDVVVTDEEGAYSLPAEAEMIIFISKPADYDVPVNEYQIPQIYYLHDPDGSPDSIPFQFPVVEPTGTLPPSVNFPLYSAKERPAFRALAFADPQAGTHRQLDYVRDDVIAEAVMHEALFAMVAGDLVNDNLAL